MANPFSDPKDSVTIHISTLSILKVLAVFAALAFLYLVWDIVVLLFISLVFAASLGPSIDWLERKRVPRGAGILLIYAALVFILSLVVVLIIPPITEQIDQLAATFPFYYERFLNLFGNLQLQSDFSQAFQSNLRSIGATLSSYTGSVVATLSGIFGGLTTLILVLVLTFYFSVRKDGLKHFIRSVTPASHQKYVENVFIRIQDKLGLWLRGQLLLSGIIFVVTWIGLMALGVKYALVLALIAGITEVIPFLGPIIGAIPAVLLAFLQSPVLALLVVVLYLVIQQLEGNVIVPKVMQRAVGLNPIIVIVVILLGAKLAGILGAILSIPVAVAVVTIAGDWFGVLVEEVRGEKT
ncbi:MAG: AI-2E family transporter [Parcubacteria group bacterium]|nr:AI-2E family transporter [Parcubacteria group bacterium]